MTFTATRKYMTVAAVFAALLFTVGCASKGGNTPEDATEKAAATGPKLLKSGQSIGAVSVSLDSSTLPADVVPVAEQYSVSSKLENALNERKEVGSGDLSLNVKVVSMRLRTKGSAVAGLYTGVDWIAIKVAVSQNGAVVKEFEDKSTNSYGGVVYMGREKRVDRMIRDLTNRIIKGV